MGERIVIEISDGVAEAYCTGSPGGPGVLLFVDAIGLRPQIEAMADRIASWGYVVVAPHVFFRSGPAAELAPAEDLRLPGARERFFDSGVGERMAALTPELSDADTGHWLAALAQTAGPGPFGVTGYCMGAGLAMRAAGLHADRIAACGGFHGGGLVTDAPTSPHLSIAGSRAEFVLGHADADASMPPEAVAVLEQELAALGRPYGNAIYPGAPHGYSMADTSMYDEAAAERHFEELRALLDRTLRAA